MEALVQFGKCLADPDTVRALAMLAKNQELCICELQDALSLTRNQADQALNHLRKAKLIVTSKRGFWLAYRVNPAMANLIEKVLGHFTDDIEWDRDVTTARERLEKLLAERVNGWCPSRDDPR